MAKTWVKNQLKKLDPIFKIIAKVLDAIIALAALLAFLISALEMLFLLVM